MYWLSAKADFLLGLSLTAQSLTWWQICVRSAVVYVVLIVFVRFAKKRFLARVTAFDAILAIIIGATASRAITGTAPFFGALAATFVLVAMHWIFSYFGCRSPAFGDLIKGTATDIIRNGRVSREGLAYEHMSSDDLEEDLRKAGIKKLSQVARAKIERDGTLSVIRR